jgi:hypothetical protein
LHTLSTIPTTKNCSARFCKILLTWYTVYIRFLSQKLVGLLLAKCWHTVATLPCSLRGAKASEGVGGKEFRMDADHAVLRTGGPVRPAHTNTPIWLSAITSTDMHIYINTRISTTTPPPPHTHTHKTNLHCSFVLFEDRQVCFGSHKLKTKKST